jgi:hypothetical protein
MKKETKKEAADRVRAHNHAVALEKLLDEKGFVGAVEELFKGVRIENVQLRTPDGYRRDRKSDWIGILFQIDLIAKGWREDHGDDRRKKIETLANEIDGRIDPATREAARRKLKEMDEAS